MTIIAAALRELMAAGVTGDALVTAVERIEIASEPRRTPGALRQQRYRERHKASQSVTSDDQYIDREDISTSTSERKIKKERKISTPLRHNASLSDADRAYARSKGWDDQRIAAEFERFRDHALANGRVQKDWPAAWRNWVTSPYQKAARVNGHGAGPDLMDAIDGLIDRAGGGSVGAGASPRDVTPRSADAG